MFQTKRDMALFIEERNTSLRTYRVRKQKLEEKGATKSRGNPENPSDELQRRRDALEKRKQDGRWKV